MIFGPKISEVRNSSMKKRRRDLAFLFLKLKKTTMTKKFSPVFRFVHTVTMQVLVTVSCKIIVTVNYSAISGFFQMTELACLTSFSGSAKNEPEYKLSIFSIKKIYLELRKL